MKTLEYYTINAKVLPVEENQTERYIGLIRNWFNKGYKIKGIGSAAFYFTLTTLDKVDYEDTEIFYGVISKFMKMDEIDFVNATTQELVAFEIPEDVKARAQQYEFIFIPKFHRFAFIKVGKIDPDIKKKGAPLKQMTSIIERAFISGLGISDSKVDVIIEQNNQVFEDIFNNTLLTLQVSVSYTNDDHLDEESMELMDNLLRDSHLGVFNASMQPDNSGEIDTSGKFVGGLISLAQQNGKVNALIETESGERKRINTEEHPDVNFLSIEGDNIQKPSYLIGLYKEFLSKYRSRNAASN